MHGSGCNSVSTNTSAVTQFVPVIFQGRIINTLFQYKFYINTSLFVID